MYYLFEMYYKLITVQYYIVDCVSWVPRLTLLNLQKIGLMNTLSEQNLLICRGLTLQEFEYNRLLNDKQGKEQIFWTSFL